MSARVQTIKVLVVDDDEGILEAVTAMLESVELQVETSLTGDVLEQLPKDNLPDFILLDVLLSGTDGRELCQKLKNERATKHIPIILTSANPSAISNVQKYGADGFLAKPFEMEALLTMIKKHSTKQRQRSA